MTAFVSTRTDPLALTDAVQPGALRFVGSTINGFLDDPAGSIAQAVAAGFNYVRLTDWLTSPRNLTNQFSDPTVWGLVDQTIGLASAAGLRVVLDLSTYRTWLAKVANLNPYTIPANWTSFFTFLAARVNSFTGRTYRDDPTIMQINIAGEPQPAGETNQANALLPVTSAQLVAFYGNTAGQLNTAFPWVTISSGGLLHYRAGSVGDTSWVDWQGIFSAIKAATPRAAAALHVYSGVDFGGAPASGDEGQVGTVASYCSANGIPLAIEEFGLDQNGGQGVWTANDALRASRFQNLLPLAITSGAYLVGFLNGGNDLYFNAADVGGSAPVHLVSGSIPAWAPGTYNALDAVSNGGSNWYSLVNGNTTTPNDNAAASWARLKTSSLDVDLHTPATYAVVAGFAAAILRAPRNAYRRQPGKTLPQVSVLFNELDALDETGVVYVDENGVPYVVGA